MTVCPAKTQISLVSYPVWSVFALCSMGSWGPKFSSCRQRRLWSDCGLWLVHRLGGCPGWSESSLGAHVILLVFIMRRLNCFVIKYVGNETLIRRQVLCLICALDRREVKTWNWLKADKQSALSARPFYRIAVLKALFSIEYCWSL